MVNPILNLKKSYELYHFCLKIMGNYIKPPQSYALSY